VLYSADLDILQAVVRGRRKRRHELGNLEDKGRKTISFKNNEEYYMCELHQKYSRLENDGFLTCTRHPKKETHGDISRSWVGKHDLEMYLSSCHMGVSKALKLSPIPRLVFY
jgi:hypothetical protein